LRINFRDPVYVVFMVEITVTFTVQFLFDWSVEDGVHKLQEAGDPMSALRGL